MKYTAEMLINELHEQYPQYTIEEFTEICLGPLAFFKKNMKSPTLPSFRFKYMGVFMVYPGVIAKMLHYNQKRFDEGIITQDTYDYYNEQMKNVHEQLSTNYYKRGPVNIVYHDESLESVTK